MISPHLQWRKRKETENVLVGLVDKKPANQMFEMSDEYSDKLEKRKHYQLERSY